MGTISDSEKLKALLQKFRAGQCTPEETEQVKQWFEALGNETASPDPAQTEQAVKDIHTSVMQVIRKEGNIKRQLRIRYLSLGAAATIALIVGIYWLFFFRAVPAYRQLATAKGEKRSFVLPDGSTVFLNAASILRIPSDFNKGKREVLLEGEGFFNVRHNSHQPFIVRSGKVYTEVLGTSFDIRAYPAASTIQVAVSSGKVRVSRQQSAAVLAEMSRNRILEYNCINDGYVVRNGEADRLAAWQQNILNFEDASLEDIAQVLERQYNVTISVTVNKTARCIYTIQFRNQPLPQVLEILASLSGISYHVQGRHITIDTKNCH